MGKQIISMGEWVYITKGIYRVHALSDLGLGGLESFSQVIVIRGRDIKEMLSSGLQTLHL